MMDISLLPDKLYTRIDFSDWDGCWLWRAGKTSDGYGTIYYNGNHQYVHRVVYELLIGEIPLGLVSDHLCRNHGCVNPYHIEPVTHRVNILRGTGASAFNVSKTHCPKGHEYTPENTFMNQGSRICRECSRVGSRTRSKHYGDRKKKEYSEGVNSIVYEYIGDKCVHGHEYTKENTVINNLGIRYCRTCHREHSRIASANYRKRHKNALGAMA